MKTETIKVLVREPGKGRICLSYATNKIYQRPAIDSKGHDLQPRDNLYVCRLMFRDNSGNLLSSLTEDQFYSGKEFEQVYVSYQSIEDAVKGEKETYMEHDDDYVGAIMDKRKESGVYEDDLVTLKSTPDEFKEYYCDVCKNPHEICNCPPTNEARNYTDIYEAKEDHALNKAAEKFLLEYSHYKESYRGPDITFNNAVRGAADFAINYRATHPIENKGYNFSDLVKAANMGSDFQAANADTIIFDTVEDMLTTNFKSIDNKEGVKRDDRYAGKEIKSAYNILDDAISFSGLDIKDNDYENIIDAMETYLRQFDKKAVPAKDFKSAEDMFNTIAYLDRAGDFFNIQKTDVIRIIEAYHAQFTAKEQGKRMVSVEEVMVLLHENFDHETADHIINQIKNLNKA